MDGRQFLGQEFCLPLRFQALISERAVFVVVIVCLLACFSFFPLEIHPMEGYRLRSIDKSSGKFVCIK